MGKRIIGVDAENFTPWLTFAEMHRLETYVNEELQRAGLWDYYESAVELGASMRWDVPSLRPEHAPLRSAIERGIARLMREREKAS